MLLIHPVALKLGNGIAIDIEFLFFWGLFLFQLQYACARDVRMRHCYELPDNFNLVVVVMEIRSVLTQKLLVKDSRRFQFCKRYTRTSRARGFNLRSRLLAHVINASNRTGIFSSSLGYTVSFRKRNGGKQS